MTKKVWIQVMLAMLLSTLMSVSFMDGTIPLNQTTYKKGDDSEDVKLIQIALALDGSYDGTEFTTTFGPKTEKAVIVFQNKYGLDADGVIGRSTIDKMTSKGLFPLLSKPMYKFEDEHNEIKFIQYALIQEGLLEIEYPTTYFATLTERAVKSFQKKYNLEADGIVGEATIEKFAALGYVKNRIQKEVASENDSDSGSGAGVETAVIVETVNTQNLSYIGSVQHTSFKKGDNNSDVALIQSALHMMGYLESDAFTTLYGDQTIEAVKKLQTASGLEADGVIGSSTFDIFKRYGILTNAVAVVSRGDQRNGEYLDWFKDVLPMAESKYGADYRGKIKIVIEDYQTGVKINALFSYGHNHMDIEPLTKEDTEKIKKLWNYKYDWTMRPVLVYYLDHVVAGSLAGMPHAGSTLDRIGDNGMSGVCDLHFRNSRTHATNKIDERHQKQVRIAAGVN
ncbi:peptidoglycan-binding protein [Fusibacter sp. 3D3]|uniref:peptidoglycan-binding domain-containing protein n=1 Tax=Fusibacter sp. 3D3 TaxID=1048380 RepID=UPI0008531EBA|nr:peptidoglycan-binding protein [Fusibacter sp. 3D3]GAU77173.1 hypothetical protein F3D3_1787 [Fusibacter sp. 3D3]